jgi:hypothetical protein
MVKKPSIINKSWDNLNEHIIEFGTLQHGWDSYSARPISVGSIVNTLYFISVIRKLNVRCPVAVPTVTGGIQLEWHINNTDLELNFDEKGGIEGYLFDEEKNLEHNWNEMITNCPLVLNDVQKFTL